MPSVSKEGEANARLYNPVLGRFLSPDPYVQAPDNTQNFNRYSYCLNNPLAYTDPDGEFIFTSILGPVGALIDAACWGAVIGAAGYTASVALSVGGFSNWDWGDFGKALGFGAASGMLTSGIGQIFGPVGSMGIGGEIGRAMIHGVSQTWLSDITGYGDPMTAFASAGLGSLGGSAFMMYGGSFAASKLGTYAFSGLAGGVGAELTGGNFWEGVAAGVMNAGLNHLASTIDAAGNRYFANRKAAYKYMWNLSFDENGNPIREVAGWEIENNALIVGPCDKNTISKSHLNCVEINGEPTYALFRSCFEIIENIC